MLTTRKFLFSMFLVCSFLIVGNAQTSNFKPQSTNHTPQINEEWEYFIKHPANSKRDDSIPAAYHHYDKAGRVLREKFYSEEGSDVRETRWKYDAHGNITEMGEYDGSGQQHSRMTYKFDDRDSLTEEASYERTNEMEYKKSYKYNKAGKKILMTQEGEQGVMKKISYAYDGHGNLLSSKETDAKDTLSFGYNYKYDDRNNCIEEVRFDGTGQQWKFVFNYTSFNKKEREQHIYQFERSNSVVTYEYDKAHNLTEQVSYDYKNKPMQKSSYKYENGRLVSEEANNSVTENKYDTAGNKIKERVLVNNKPLSEKTFDKQGNMLTWTHYAPPGILSFSETFVYDNSTPRKLQKSTKMSKDGVIIEQSESKYDRFGNLTEELNMGVNGKIVSQKAIVYKYY